MIVFTTGGTIDGIGGGNKDQPTTTNVPKLLQEGNCQLKVRVQQLFVKNSCSFSPGDLGLILKSCAEAEEQRIVVTHGTHTICHTARFLGDHEDEELRGKTVVLTGAMNSTLKPGSDGPFNLGSALMAAGLLPPGVYVVMQGQVFPWHSVQKDETSDPKRFVGQAL